MKGRRAAPDDPSIRALTVIPGIGRSIARDLIDLGIRSVDDLIGRDPGKLYRELCAIRGGPVDRCVLYVFRCAAYYASTAERDPELLKWWNWKDRDGAE